MNKKIVAFVVAVALVLGAGALYWVQPDFLQGNAVGKKGAVEKVIKTKVKKEIKQDVKRDAKKGYSSTDSTKSRKSKPVKKAPKVEDVPLDQVPTI